MDGAGRSFPVPFIVSRQVISSLILKYSDCA
jgi:hypothetical protein